MDESLRDVCSATLLLIYKSQHACVCVMQPGQFVVCEQADISCTSEKRAVYKGMYAPTQAVGCLAARSSLKDMPVRYTQEMRGRVDG